MSTKKIKRTASQIGKGSKTKGAVGEREFAKLLCEHGFESHRGRQYCGGNDSADVKCSELDDMINFEVKRVERLNLEAAFKQAEGDSKGKTIPVVSHRRNSGKWMITLEAREYLAMLREYLDMKRGDIL